MQQYATTTDTPDTYLCMMTYGLRYDYIITKRNNGSTTTTDTTDTTDTYLCASGYHVRARCACCGGYKLSRGAPLQDGCRCMRGYSYEQGLK